MIGLFQNSGYGSDCEMNGRFYKFMHDTGVLDMTYFKLSLAIA